MKKMILSLLALLMTAATGAWAQSAFTVKALTSATQFTSTDDAAYMAANMPNDFLAVDLDAAKTWTGGPTGEMVYLVHGINGNNVKLALFDSGNFYNDGEVDMTIAYFKSCLSSRRFFYTAAATYSVSMKDATGENPTTWTAKAGTDGEFGALPLTGVTEGQAVTLKYSGRLKVKKVTAELAWNGNLSNIPASALESDGMTVIVTDGMTLTGTLDGATQPYKIVIADGATVTLNNAVINGVNDENYPWAGLNCEGDATIILADGSDNKVTAFYENYPGIYVPEVKILTIEGGTEGTGKLTASAGLGNGAGIGGGADISCGNIEIHGGVITAIGGGGSAGIGSGPATNDVNSCGNIRISGGTVTATGGGYGAGIGTGCSINEIAACSSIFITGGTVTATGGVGAAGIGVGAKKQYSEQLTDCGQIIITDGVTKVTATKGEGALNSIGGGKTTDGVCISVIIGGTVYWSGSDYQNGGERYLTQATIVYPNIVNLSELTDHVTATYGATITGTLDGSTQPYKITIADGATVTLDGATINGANNNCEWAGINCEGDATIILKGTNTVNGFLANYPGIHVPSGKTLTIQGDGSLDAYSNGYGAAIGGGYFLDCGNIVIEGGDIMATAGFTSAGIGSGPSAACGNITITTGVTRVAATAGSHSYNIGKGEEGSCGTVTIGGTVYYDGSNFQNDGYNYLLQDLFVYPATAVPLTMEAITDGTIVISNPQTGMQYSINAVITKDMSGDSYTIDVSAGDKVAFYGKGTDITSYYSSTSTRIAGGTAKVKLYGNIMSLVDEYNYVTATTLTAESTFSNLFLGNQNLTDASGLLLPATTLTKSCYERMFQSCTSMTAAPELPATTLAPGCYSNMFAGCFSLTAAPELPATTLAKSCYKGMFTQCIALTAAPELPATTLAESCYSGMFTECSDLTAAPELKAETLAPGCYSAMFAGCSSLTAAPELKATTLAEACYSNMFYGCGTLRTAPELPATTLAPSCYSGMFENCPLAKAPKLPATTLAESCYSRMFFECVSLGSSPVLPATTLVKDCYRQMFQGCGSLNFITCLATDISAEGCTADWVKDACIEHVGKFIKPETMTSWTTGNSGIPEGWTVENAPNN